MLLNLIGTRGVLCGAVWASVLALSASGCWSKDSDGDDKNLGPEINDTVVTGQYKLADTSCQDSGGDLALGNEPVWQFKGATSSTGSVQMSESRSGVNGLTAPGIQATYFGLHVRQQCTVTDAGKDCKGGELISKPKFLKVCKAGQSYPQNSIEAAGISSLAHITAAYGYYKNLAGADGDMAQANIFVIPLIEKVLTNPKSGRSLSVFESDNLAYLHDYIGAPAFLIFPKGATSQKLGVWKNLNLWEAPWTLAHEFGHHVLKTHTNVSGFSSLRQRSFDGFSGLDGLIKLPSENNDVQVERTAAGDRIVGRDLIWDGMNEGFADLFAFYVRGAQPGQSSGIDCFAKNRDIESPVFVNGAAKSLTASNMTTFVSTSKIDTNNSDCSYPDMQDIHIIGAIMAHGVNDILSRRTGDTGNAAAVKARAELVLRWTSRLAGIAKQSSFKLQELILPALEMASDNGNLNTAQCATLRRVFPAFEGEWLSGGTIRCASAN